MRFLVTFIILCCFVGFASAQILEVNPNPRKNLKQALLFYDMGKYREAAYLFNVSLEEKYKDEETVKKSAEANFNARNYKKAEENYAWLVSFYNNSFSLYRYYYALSMKNQSMFSEAEQEFEKFYRNFSGDERYLQLTEIEIASCKHFLQNSKDGKEARPLTSLNRVKNQTPTQASISIDNSYCLGLQKDTVYLLEEVNIDQPQLYYSDSIAGSPNSFNNDINNSAFFNREVSLSSNKDMLIFTRCAKMPETNLEVCHLFYSVKLKGVWTEPKRFPEEIDERGSNSKYGYLAQFEGQKLLFYASNRPGGYGGYDIYMAQLDDSNQVVSNTLLNENINTPNDEITPFFDVILKRLYYSSNGKKGYGMFDIYYVSDITTDAEPSQMQAPYNSVFNDFSYSTSLDYAMFISDRPSVYKDAIGYDKNNLYTVEVDQFYVSAQIDENIPQFKVRVINHEDTIQPIVHELTESVEQKPLRLLPEKEYEIELSAPGYESKTVSISTKNKDKADTVVLQFTLEPIHYVLLSADSTAGYSQYQVNLYREEPLGDSLINTYKRIEARSSIALNIEKNYGYTAVCGAKGYFCDHFRLYSNSAVPDTFVKTFDLEPIDQDSLYSFGELKSINDSTLKIDVNEGIYRLRDALPFNGNVDLTIYMKPPGSDNFYVLNTDEISSIEEKLKSKLENTSYQLNFYSPEKGKSRQSKEASLYWKLNP